MNNYKNEIFSNSILSKVVQITMVKFERHIFNEKKKRNGKNETFRISGWQTEMWGNIAINLVQCGWFYRRW